MEPVAPKPGYYKVRVIGINLPSVLEAQTTPATMEFEILDGELAGYHLMMIMPPSFVGKPEVLVKDNENGNKTH